MFKEKFLLIVGVIVIALPNMGFSNFVDKIIFAFFGLLIILTAYALYFENTRKKEKRPRVRHAEPVEISRGKEEEITGFTYVKKDHDVS